MPSRNCQAGDIVFIRATVLEACSDTFKVRIDDERHMAVTVWLPVSEIARAEDIGRLRPRRRAVPRPDR